MTYSSSSGRKSFFGYRRVGWISIAGGAIALLACEIPLVVALAGFGGAVAFNVPLAVEIAGGVAVLAGIVSLSVHMARRRKKPV